MCGGGTGRSSAEWLRGVCKRISGSEVVVRVGQYIVDPGAIQTFMKAPRHTCPHMSTHRAPHRSLHALEADAAYDVRVRCHHSGNSTKPDLEVYANKVWEVGVGGQGALMSH